MAVAACSVAAMSALAAGEALPPVVKVLEERGVSDIQEFKAGNDVRGFAGTAAQRPFVVYVTKDGNAIVGTRIDAQGASLDAKTVDALVVQPMEEATWKRLESLNWVREGRADAPRVIYIFTDAACPWCHRFFDAARPWVASGKVQLRQLYVGVIRPDSGAKAAAILTAPNPVEAAERNERDFDKGGIAPLAAIPDAVQRTLDVDLQLMGQNGFRGTPGLVYRAQGGRMKSLGGYPQGDQMVDVLGPR